MNLIRPALPFLASYSDALRTGWSPNNARNVAAEELQMIARDAPQLREFAREWMREYRLALHHAAVAIGRLFAGLAAIDQHDLLAALLQMHRD